MVSSCWISVEGTDCDSLRCLAKPTGGGSSPSAWGTMTCSLVVEVLLSIQDPVQISPCGTLHWSQSITPLSMFLGLSLLVLLLHVLIVHWSVWQSCVQRLYHPVEFVFPWGTDCAIYLSHPLSQTQYNSMITPQYTVIFLIDEYFNVIINCSLKIYNTLKWIRFIVPLVNKNFIPIILYSTKYLWRVHCLIFTFPFL